MSFSLGIGMFNQWIKDIAVDEFIKNIKECGAGFAEFKISVKNFKEKLPLIKKTVEAGLDITVHAPFDGKYNPFYFSKNKDNETFALYGELLIHLNEIADLKKSTLLVNTHAASADENEADFADLLEKSIDFYNWLISEINKSGQNIKITAELLPFDKGKIKVGCTTEELINLSSFISGESVDFCWDMGHFYTNQINNLSDNLSEKFFNKVKHIHIHDIRDVGNNILKDHMPLEFGAVPYSKYLSYLLNNNIQRKAAIEINYEHAVQLGKPYSLLYSSMVKLKEEIYENSAFSGKLENEQNHKRNCKFN